MKKIINDPRRFVAEMLDGVIAAHGDDLRRVESDQAGLCRADMPIQGRVGIVTGGGSGHLPLFLGYVGRGLCAGVAIGNVFASPDPSQIHAVAKAVDGGAGVLFLYGNYGGDVLNFDLAADMCADDGIELRTVLVTDDVVSAPAHRRADRRGVAGLFFAYKIAGAAAEEGRTLAEVADLAQRAVDRTATMGVGLTPTILPAAGAPTFAIGDNEMEVGVGIHGERGFGREPLATADAIAVRLIDACLEDLHPAAHDTVAVLVNGLGATPLEELYVLYRGVHQVLQGRELKVHRAYVGEFATSLEMAGASVSVLLLDERLTTLLDAPAASPFFCQ